MTEAQFAILPVPFEATTTYKKGTKKGPKSILNALEEVELYDEELGAEICLTKNSFLPPLKLLTRNLKDAHGKICQAVQKVLQDKKMPILLGGEHSITYGVVKAAHEKFPQLSVLQIDAHADLRDIYGGTKYSHAAVMRRVLEVCPAVQVGIRNISQEGMEFAKKSGQREKIFWAREWDDNKIESVMRLLGEEVYITIDVDGFDPSIIPATGTPEPGGLGWYAVLKLLRQVFSQKKVVGFDIVELLPQPALHMADFAMAKLLHKMVGYKLKGR